MDYPLLQQLRRRTAVAFLGLRVADFVAGCFWHRSPKHGSQPRTNRDWRKRKLDRNVQRDRDTDACLLAAGWSIVRVSEHEAVDVVAALVAQIVRARSAMGSSPGRAS